MFGSSRTSGLQVLSHAASRLLSRPVSLSAGPAFLPSLPSAKRLSELVLFMRSAHDGLVADPYYGGHFLRPSASRCAAGTIEPGSLVKVRCMEICAMCETYLGLLDARSGEARALLELSLIHIFGAVERDDADLAGFGAHFDHFVGHGLLRCLLQ